MGRTLVQMTALVAVGLAAGFAVNPFTPRAVAPSVPVLPASASATASCSGPHEAAEAAPKAHPRMPREQALAACVACSAAFVDARGEAAYAQGHITGAIHLPPEGHPEAPAAFDKLRGFSTVVVYDDDVGCRLAEGVADRLVSEGFSDVRVLDGSWSEWMAAQGPAQAGACEVCGHPALHGEASP